jgi:hypothetical protein
MPLTLKTRIGFDTLAKLERAATRRQAEAMRLIDDEPLGAIYLLGYSIEMRLKAAHYRLASIPGDHNLSKPIPPNTDSPRKLAENRIKTTLAKSSSAGHDLVGWTEPVIESRVLALLPALAVEAELRDHIKEAALCWTESLRYHANKPYNEEVQAVLTAARWIRQHYRQLWS